MSNYSGHLLCTGTGANADFFSVPVKIEAGTNFNPLHDIKRNILLAGGFSAIHPESPFPLSPTLQLNGDLTDRDTAGMTALARAELNHYNNLTYRSYTLESDSRVTVLGSDANALLTFVNTYGGVLQIDPLLLKGYAPDLTTAQELQTEPLKNGFKLNFTVKQPIDWRLCSYCGACGPACPEQCLNEQLFLDFSHCSFCKECVAVCAHEAIDLYAVEQRELTTPVILLLDGAEIDLPQEQQKKNLYSEDTLSTLFASIYATEVEEALGWDASICQYSARLNTGCTACLAACRHGAVKQGKNGVQIDHLACVECGACLSSCPTGALQYQRFTDSHFMEYFRTAPLPPGTTVILGNEQALHRHWWYTSRQRRENIFYMEHPQPAALHAMHFLLLYGMGAKQIVVLENKNSKATQQVQLTNMLLQRLFGQKLAIQLVPVETVNNFLDENESSEKLTSFYHDFSYSNRREKFMDLLQFLRLQSTAEPAVLTGSTAADFGEILCNEEKCTHCIACVNECRVGALSADSGTYTLKHTPALCVQCGICVSICPESALSVQNGLSVTEQFFTEKIAAKAEPARCKGCGKIFGTQKSLERVVAILTAKKMWNSEDDLLSYCDSCRVVNLYESSGKDS